MSKLRDLIADAEIDLLTLALACHLLLFFDLLAQISGNVKAGAAADKSVALADGPIVPQALVVDLDVPQLGNSSDSIVLRAAVEIDGVLFEGAPPVDLNTATTQPLGTRNIRLSAQTRPNHPRLLRSLKLEIEPAADATLPAKVVLHVRRDRQRSDGVLAAADKAGWAAACAASDSGLHDFSHVGLATGPAWQASAKAMPSATVAAAWLPTALLTHSATASQAFDYEFQLDGPSATFTHRAPPATAPLPPGNWQTVFFRAEVTIQPADTASSDDAILPPTVSVSIRPTNVAPAALAALPHP